MKQTILALILAVLTTGPVYAVSDAGGEAVPGQQEVESPADQAAQAADSEIRSEVREVIADLRREFDNLDETDRAELERMLGQGVEVQFGHDEHMSGIGVLIPILAISLSLGGPIIIVAIVLYAAYRKRRQRLELIAKFVDNNREIPQEVLSRLDADGIAKSDLRSGLLAMGAGLGVILGLGVLAGWEVGALGLIPFFIGLARLLVWKLEQPRT